MSHSATGAISGTLSIDKFPVLLNGVTQAGCQLPSTTDPRVEHVAYFIIKTPVLQSLYPTHPLGWFQTNGYKLGLHMGKKRSATRSF